MKKIVNWIVIIILLVGINIVAMKLFPPKGNTVVKTETVTKVDTVYTVDTVVSVEYKPKYITKVVTDWKYHEIDTAAILQEYFNKNYYQDTLVNDSSLFVEVRDTVSQNQIISRDFSIIRTYPTIYETTTTTNTVEKNELFVGGYIGQDYGLQLQYNFKKHMIGAGGGKGGLFVSYSYRIGK